MEILVSEQLSGNKISDAKAICARAFSVSYKTNVRKTELTLEYGTRHSARWLLRPRPRPQLSEADDIAETGIAERVAINMAQSSSQIALRSAFFP